MTRLDRLPIRAKIAAACALLTAAAVVVFSIGTLVNLYHEQIEAADLELVEEVRHVTHLIEASGADHGGIQAALTDVVEPWVAFAVIEQDGTVWRSRESLPDELVRAVLPGERPRTVRGAEGSWRVQSVAMGDRYVVVTVDLEEVHDIVTDLVFAYLLALPLAGIVAGVGGWAVAGWALQPVRRVTETAAAIDARNLSARVPEPSASDEIADLARMLNAMLARLERSFEQAERFAADASHELRTPLTIMRGEVEVLLRDEGLPEAAERSLVSLQEEVDHLERITGNLLLLAKLDAGAALAAERLVDFSALVNEACEDLEPMIASREVALGSEIAQNIFVMGDDTLLRRVVFNVLENAAKFNEPGGHVRVRLTGDAGGVRFVVENTGPGIPEELRARVFDRFVRADPARLRSGYGLGLGLAREIARAHGGDVVLDPAAPPSWTRFAVHLPTASARDTSTESTQRMQ